MHIDKIDEHTRFIDLSHTIEDGLVTYRGLPAPIICDYLSRERSRELYDAGTEFQIGKIEMVANTGTYIDFPFHRYKEGKTSRRSVSSISPISKELSSGPITKKPWLSMRDVSKEGKSGERQSWFIPAGMQTGIQKGILMTTLT